MKGFFDPKSVAVVGASREPGKVGYDILKNLIDAGFKGELFPINPKADEILNIDAYPDLLHVPADEIDLVIVVIPAKYVLGIVDQCSKKGVKAIIVISAGFKESGGDGVEQERLLAEKCKSYGIRCIGPNCLGVICTDTSLNASFAACMPHNGNIAFISQSGALGTAILDISLGEKIGFSKFISTGNKVDVDETDLIAALADDPNTKVILGYIESVQDGRNFLRVAAEASRKKPIIIMKSGRTAAGARAASSHTGALAGSDMAYDCAFEKTGVLRAETVQNLFDWAIALENQSPPVNNKIAIVTNAGGPGIVATDAIEQSMLEMAKLAPETEEKLKELLPPAANIHNPIDVLGDGKADRYEAALKTALKDPNVGSVLVIVTPQTSTEVDATAEVVRKIAQTTEKPVLSSFMGIPAMEEAKRILKSFKVPNYQIPERAVSALETMYKYRLHLDKPEQSPRHLAVDMKRVEVVLDAAAAAGRDELGELEAREIIEAYGMALPKSVLAASADEAVDAAEKTGYPVVMKISSPDILHKSDVGGVAVGLESAEEVAAAFDRIIKNSGSKVPGADIKGVLVQEMVKGGKEVILGVNRDAQFGPMIMFGLGGIYVEVLKDVAFAVAPVTESEARAMVENIKTSDLLKGVRGEAASDIDSIVDSIQRLSQLVCDFPSIAEADINPLKVFERGTGVVAVDARFRIEK